jgi:hypothetical protein
MLNDKKLLKCTYCICWVIYKLLLKNQKNCKDFIMTYIEYDGVFVL